MLTLFFTVALVHIVALMSPGPDFFFVSQTAVSRSRKEAMMGVLADIDQLERQSGAKPSALYALLAEHPHTADRVEHIRSL